MKKLMQTVLGFTSMMMMVGCDKPVESFSLLAESTAFKQSVAYIPRKIDILWVVDSSGSMASSQTNLANNFRQFIQDFETLGLDFHMAVVDTGGYLDNHYNTWNRSGLRDGTGTNRSGVYVMTKDTPDLENVFIKNIKTGTSGTGDERAFSSFKKSLENANNVAFRRPGAYLAVIIVSDEDDFSHYDWQNGTSSYFFTEDYNHASMFSISYFTDFLNTLTNSTTATAKENYAVHTISILDNACLTALANNAQKISQRYQQLATAANGISASLCSPMSVVLDQLSKSTIQAASVFRLEREPWPESLSVSVNGAMVPESTTCGWSYDETQWIIRFHGSGSCIPSENADVRIYFEPKSPQ